MAKGVQFRRGTTAEHSNFTGAEGEITIDTDKDVAIVHDGSTVGGKELVGVGATQRITNKDIEANTLSVSGIVTASAFYDPDGNIRRIPENFQSASYILSSDDVGKYIGITTGGVTVPASVFTAGDAIIVYNNNPGTQSISSGIGVTVYFAGTSSTGTRYLSQRGLATILCVGVDEFVISGAGIS